MVLHIFFKGRWSMWWRHHKGSYKTRIIWI